MGNSNLSRVECYVCHPPSRPQKVLGSRNDGAGCLPEKGPTEVALEGGGVEGTESEVQKFRGTREPQHFPLRSL